MMPKHHQVLSIISKANTIIERVQIVISDILRSFDLESNNENLEEDYPFGYCLQSTT
jgi:hypothetical protein